MVTLLYLLALPVLAFIGFYGMSRMLLWRSTKTKGSYHQRLLRDSMGFSLSITLGGVLFVAAVYCVYQAAVTARMAGG